MSLLAKQIKNVIEGDSNSISYLSFNLTTLLKQSNKSEFINSCKRGDYVGDNLTDMYIKMFPYRIEIDNIASKQCSYAIKSVGGSLDVNAKLNVLSHEATGAKIGISGALKNNLNTCNMESKEKYKKIFDIANNNKINYIKKKDKKFYPKCTDTTFYSYIQGIQDMESNINKNIKKSINDFNLSIVKNITTKKYKPITYNNVRFDVMINKGTLVIKGSLLKSKKTSIEKTKDLINKTVRAFLPILIFNQSSNKTIIHKDINNNYTLNLSLGFIKKAIGKTISNITKDKINLNKYITFDQGVSIHFERINKQWEEKKKENFNASLDVDNHLKTISINKKKYYQMTYKVPLY